MFDIGWSELLVLAVIALIVLGPKDFPLIMRKIGQYLGAARRMADDFHKQLDDVAQEIEKETIGDLQQDSKKIKSTITASLDSVLNGSADNPDSETETSVETLKANQKTSKEAEQLLSQPKSERILQNDEK